MTRVVGDRTAFALEIGERMSVGLQVVDVWASGVRLTTDDNMAYVPSFCHYLRHAAEQVERQQIQPCPFPERSPEEIFRLLEADKTGFRERYWFMKWSEILDNVSSYAYLDDDLVLAFAFNRAGHSDPFVARIPPKQFVASLLEAVDVLDAG